MLVRFRSEGGYPLTPIVVINHPLSASSIYYDPWHPPCSIYMPDSLLFHNLCSRFLWSTSWPGTLHFIFLHPVIVFFCSTCPYYRNLFCCSTKITSSNPNLSEQHNKCLTVGWIFVKLRIYKIQTRESQLNFGWISIVQCFDAVGWVAGRASGP